MPLFGGRRAVALAVLAGLAGTEAAIADGTNQFYGTVGTAATSQTNFKSVNAPVLNQQGDIAFVAGLSGNGVSTPSSGIFAFSGSSLYAQVLDLGAYTGGAQTFTNFASPAIDTYGQLAFWASVNGDGTTTPKTGIFSDTGVVQADALQLGTYGSGTPAYSSFHSSPSASAAGVAFYAALNGNGTTSPNSAVLYSNLSSITGGVAQGTTSGGGLIVTLYDPVINDSGNVGFAATLNGNGTTTASSGLFTNSGAVALQLLTYTGGPGTFVNFPSHSAISSSGQLAFAGNLNGDGVTTPRSGIFVGTGGTLPTAVALQFGSYSGGTAQFSGFQGSPQLNNNGQVAFGAYMKTAPNAGIFLGSAGATPIPIALANQSTPDHATTFGSFDFSTLAINNIGDVAFVATLGNSGNGLYIADSREVVAVAQIGDNIYVSPNSNINGRGYINDFGQVAYSYGPVSSSVALWTPTLHYRSTAGGPWDTSGNWTLGLTPAYVHDVVLDPTFGLVVTGPSSTTTIKSLIIGAKTSGIADLQMTAGGSLITTGNLTINPSGRLDQSVGSTTVKGAFLNRGLLTIAQGGSMTQTAGTATNSGVISLNGGQFNGPALTNDFAASIIGNGAIGAAFTNNGQLTATGVITFGAPATNNGTFQVSNGTLAGTGALTNGPTGLVQGSGVISAPMTNAGGLIHVVAGAPLTLSNFSDNNSGGELRIEESGNLDVTSAFTNSGTLTLKGLDATFSGGTISNTGTLIGLGRVANTLLNSGAVRAEGGQLTLSAAANTNTALGQIQAATGSTVFYTQGLASNAGTIALAGGAFDNNNQPLSNAGTINGNGIIRTGGLNNLSAGVINLADAPGSVYGPLGNSGSLKVINTLVSFYGPVTNNAGGAIKTTTGTARFLSTFTNSGSYSSDPADNYFYGNFSQTPGATMTGGPGDRFFLSGGTFANAGAWTVTGTLRTSDPIINSGTFVHGGPLTSTAGFTNSGSVGITGAQSWAAGSFFNNTAGSATLGSDSGAGGANLTFNITGGAVAFTASQHVAGLNVNGGNADIQRNSVAIVYGTGADPNAAVTAEILWGRAGGSGIISSTAAANQSVGWIDNTATKTELIRTVYNGDANLDGVVDFTDFIALSNHFGVHTDQWSQGDFNGDGVVNFQDFVILSNDFNSRLPVAQAADIVDLARTLAANPAERAQVDALAARFAQTPEPSSLGLLAVGLPLLARRGRRS